MNIKVIANALDATQIFSVEVWAKVLLAKATVNGRTVVRFVSKKLIASEISECVARLKEEYKGAARQYKLADEYEWSEPFESVEEFVKKWLRVELDSSIQECNREIVDNAKWEVWVSRLGMSREKIERGAYLIDGMYVYQAVNKFSCVSNFNLFMGAIADVMPWISVVEKSKVRQF